MRCFRKNTVQYTSVCYLLILVLSALQPYEAFADIYGSIQYYGDFFVIPHSFTGTEDASGVITREVLGWNSDSTAPEKYNPNYTTNYIAGGFSLGHTTFFGLKTEFEAQYYNVVPDSTNFTIKDDSKYFELARKDNITGSYNPTTRPEMARNAYAFSIGSESRGVKRGILDTTSQATFNSNDVPGGRDHLAVKFRNEGIRSISGYFNIGLELNVPGIPISPFIFGGVGVAQMRFLDVDTYGIAYQGKVGVTYNIGSYFGIFAGYSYRGVLPRKYSEITPTTSVIGIKKTSSVPDVIASTTVTIENSLTVHGLMAGLIARF